MQLTSEQVHWLFGAVVSILALALMGLSLMRAKPRFGAYLAPSAFIFLGLVLVFDLWLHGDKAPADYEAEAAQHLTLGAFLVAIGIAELAPRLLGWHGLFWRMPIALALVVAGAVFLFHQQHATDAAMSLVAAQHRLLGFILALSGVARAWAVVEGRDPDGERSWLFLSLALGVALLLYTERAEMNMSAIARGAGAALFPNRLSEPAQ